MYDSSNLIKMRTLLKRTHATHQRPPTPIDDPPQKEIKDECGRNSHNKKLKFRDFCKRLCHAPSMTQELDTLYTEYIQNCSENNADDGCRMMHNVPSGNAHGRRRSILKETSSGGAMDIVRKNSISAKGHVRFGGHIEIISAITKVNGLEATLREPARIRLLHQLKQGKSDLLVEEKYPLHSRDPKKLPPKGGHRHHNLQVKGASDDEEEEEKSAKLDLTRIYFTTEAARLIACTTAGTWDARSLTMKAVKKAPLPHFYADRLEADSERVKSRKITSWLSAVNSEMDAFDYTINQKPEVHYESGFYFDPKPSEKSFNDLKLKVEILKRQRERDVEAAAERNRCRKSFFKEMLPSFSDVIRDDLLDYSIKKASRLSEEELTLAAVSLGIANQRKMFEEHQQYAQDDLINAEKQNLMKVQKHNEQIEKLQNLVAKMATQDKDRYNYETVMRRQETNAEMNEQLVTDILEVVVDVVTKISHYRSATGQNPPERLYQEWKVAGFAAMPDDTAEEVIPRPSRMGTATGAADLLNELRINDYLTCTGDWSLDNGFSESFQTPENETLRNFVESVMETLFPWPKTKTNYPKLKTAAVFSFCGLDYKWDSEKIRDLTEMLMPEYKFEIIDVDTAIKEAIMAYCSSVKPFHMKYPKDMVHSSRNEMKWTNDLHPAVALQLDRLDGTKPDHSCFQMKLNLLDGIKMSSDGKVSLVDDNSLKSTEQNPDGEEDIDPKAEECKVKHSMDSDDDDDQEILVQPPCLKLDDKMDEDEIKKKGEQRIRFKSLPKANGTILPSWLLAPKPQAFLKKNRHGKPRLVVRRPNAFFRSETLTIVRSSMLKNDPPPIAGRVPKWKHILRTSSRDHREIHLGKAILMGLYNGKGISDELIAQLIVDKLLKCAKDSVALILNYPNALCQALALETTVKRLLIEVPPCYHHSDTVIEHYRQLWGELSGTGNPASLYVRNNMSLYTDETFWKRSMQEGNQVKSRLLASQEKNPRNQIHNPEDLMKFIEREIEAAEKGEEKKDILGNGFDKQLDPLALEKISFESFIDAFVIAETELKDKFSSESVVNHANRIMKLVPKDITTPNRHELLLRFAFLQLKKFYQKKNLAEVIPKGASDALHYGTMVEVIQEVLKKKAEEKGLELDKPSASIILKRKTEAETAILNSDTEEEEEAEEHQIHDRLLPILVGEDGEQELYPSDGKHGRMSVPTAEKKRGSKQIESTLQINDHKRDTFTAETEEGGVRDDEGIEEDGFRKGTNKRKSVYSKKAKSKAQVHEVAKPLQSAFNMSTLSGKRGSEAGEGRKGGEHEKRSMDAGRDSVDVDRGKEDEVRHDKKSMEGAGSTSKTDFRSSEMRVLYGDEFEGEFGEFYDNLRELQKEDEDSILTEKELLLRYLKHVAKENLENIANIWMNMETNFLRIIKSVLSNIRTHHDAVAQHAADMRATFTEILERPDERQAIVSAFQEEFNSIDQEIRGDTDVKTELHARVDELVKKLETISNDKYDFSKEEIFRLLNDGYLQRKVKVQVNLFIALLQAETERFIETIMFINEFFKALQLALPDIEMSDDLAEFDLEGLAHLRHHIEWDIDTEGSKASTYDSEVSLPENPLSHSVPQIPTNSNSPDEAENKRKTASTAEFKLPLDIPQESQSAKMSLVSTEGNDFWSPEFGQQRLSGDEMDEEFEGEGEEMEDYDGLPRGEENMEEEEQEEEGDGVEGVDVQRSMSMYSFDAEPSPNDPRDFDLFDPIEYFDDESIFFEQDDHIENERSEKMSLTPTEENTDNLSVNTGDDDSVVGDEDSIIDTSETSAGDMHGSKRVSLFPRPPNVEKKKQPAAEDGGGKRTSLMSTMSKFRKDKPDARARRETNPNIRPELADGPGDSGGDPLSAPLGSKSDGPRTSIQRPKELAILKKNEAQVGKTQQKSEARVSSGAAGVPSTNPPTTATTAPPTAPTTQTTESNRYPPLPRRRSKKRKRPRRPDYISSSTEDELEKHWKEMHLLAKGRGKRERGKLSQAQSQLANLEMEKDAVRIQVGQLLDNLEFSQTSITMNDGTCPGGICEDNVERPGEFEAQWPAMELAGEEYEGEGGGAETMTQMFPSQIPKETLITTEAEGGKCREIGIRVKSRYDTRSTRKCLGQPLSDTATCTPALTPTTAGGTSGRFDPIDTVDEIQNIDENAVCQDMCGDIFRGARGLSGSTRVVEVPTGDDEFEGEGEDELTGSPTFTNQTPNDRKSKLAEPEDEKCRDKGGPVKKYGTKNKHLCFVHPTSAMGAATLTFTGGAPPATHGTSFYPSDHTEGTHNMDESGHHHHHHHHHHMHLPPTHLQHHVIAENGTARKEDEDDQSDDLIDEILFDENASITDDSEYIDMVDVTYVTADTGKTVRRTFLDQIVDNQVEAFYYFDAISDHLKGHVRKVEQFVIDAIQKKYPDEPPPPAIVLVPESAKKEYLKRIQASKKSDETTPPRLSSDNKEVSTPDGQNDSVETQGASHPSTQQHPPPPNTPVDKRKDFQKKRKEKLSKYSISGEGAGGKQLGAGKSEDMSNEQLGNSPASEDKPQAKQGAGSGVNESKSKHEVDPSTGATDAESPPPLTEIQGQPNYKRSEPVPHHPRPLTPREAALKEFMFPHGIIAYPSDPIINEMTAPQEGKLRDRVQMWQRAFQFESVRVKYQLSLVECKALWQLGQFKSIITQVLQDAKVQASNFFVDEVKRASEVASLFRFAIENEAGVQPKIIIEKDRLYLEHETNDDDQC